MRRSVAQRPLCADLSDFRIQSLGFPFCAVVVFVVLMSQASTAFADNDEEQVVKWITSAQESGSLKVDFYPPDKQPNAFPGWTDFELTLEYQYDQKTRWMASKGNKLTVTIVPRFTVIKPRITHVIKLPESIDVMDWHESELGRHELDHVAIGSHPRLVMLTTHWLKNLGTIRRTVERTSEVTQKWAQASITEEVDDRRRAVQLLVTTNNERLDDLTRHGCREIRDRGAFFDRLFMKENLDESKFEYLGEVLKLLETDDYRHASGLLMK